MSNDLSNISNFLKSKHIKISSNNEWLRECCDFYISSHVQESNSNLQNFVFEQWLLADLQDINEQCLPRGLQNESCTKINGTFALQVNEVLNIAESCYSQLRKIYNKESASIPNQDEEMLPSWAPKFGRMLKLTLTDGTQSLFGIEYTPIAILREPFIPGFKVLIFGPVECRRGILLLNSSNIRILGGEADSLLISNATENILSRKLNVEENPNSLLGAASIDQNAHYIVASSNAMPGDQPDSEYSAFYSPNSSISSNTTLNPIINNMTTQLARPFDLSALEFKSTISSPTSTSSLKNNSEGTMCKDFVSSGKKEKTPIVGVVCPVVSSKRCADSPPPTEEKSIKVIRRNANEINSAPMKPTSANDAPSKKVCELNELVIRKMRCSLICLASVTKLVSKPRIRNDNWHVVIEISDDTASAQVVIRDSFLEDQVFGISAFEVLSQKDRMITNPEVKKNIDQILRSGVQKMLTMSGHFHMVTIPNELPVVNEIHKISF